MSYIEGEDRRQEQCLPARIEEYVAENAPVRFIDAFVESLDFKALGFERAEAARTGRPGYDPKDLLRLYAYGYLNRIRSSRRLETEAGRNLEVIWLLRGLKPDFKTIADFRKNNRLRFKRVLREFNLLCRKMELFGAQLVAIDGAKFKAVNNPRRHYSAEQLKGLVKRIDERIEEYIKEMESEEEACEGVPGAPEAKVLQEKIEQLKNRRAVYEQLDQAMTEQAMSEVSLTDPDSRGQRKVVVGYNVQVAVDAKHDLIVESEVKQEANDLKQLYPMGTAAMESLQVDTLLVVADAGYHSADQLEACEQAGLTTYVPEPGRSYGRDAEGHVLYPKEHFKYDPANECYHCPANETLPKVGQGEKNGKAVFYYENLQACRQCVLRSNCTTASYRKLSRLKNAEVIERQAQRVAAHPELVSERKTIVEHVFGTLRLWHHDHFLCRGLESVRAEFSLSALTYNLRRALNILGVQTLLQALTTLS